MKCLNVSFSSSPLLQELTKVHGDNLTSVSIKGATSNKTVCGFCRMESIPEHMFVTIRTQCRNARKASDYSIILAHSTTSWFGFRKAFLSTFHTLMTISKQYTIIYSPHYHAHIYYYYWYANYPTHITKGKGFYPIGHSFYPISINLTHVSMISQI